VLIHLCRGVFMAPLRSNERGALLLLRVRFRGSVFTELVPSSELFRLSDVMSQCILIKVDFYLLIPL
jgi:hypothetical protein